LIPRGVHSLHRLSPAPHCRHEGESSSRIIHLVRRVARARNRAQRLRALRLQTSLGLRVRLRHRGARLLALNNQPHTVTLNAFLQFKILPTPISIHNHS
jgi:hypothetical protein